MNMQITLRSQLIAGVALVSAGAIVATPIQPNVATITADYTPAAVQVGLINPITAFAPVALLAIDDLSGIVRDVIRDPAPILRVVANNQLGYAQSTATAAVQAGVVVSDAAWELPRNLAYARYLVRQGDLDGALTVIEGATVVPAFTAAGIVVGNAAQVVQSELRVALALAEVLPAAALSVANTTFYAADQIARAQIDAFEGVVEAAQTGRPVRVVNAITTGAVHVATVAEQVTIGDGIPEDGGGGTELQKIEPRQAPSIKIAVRDAQYTVAKAISVQRYKVAEDDAATAVVAEKSVVKAAAATKARPDVNAISKSIRKELKSAGKAIRAALKAPSKKAAAAD